MFTTNVGIPDPYIKRIRVFFWKFEEEGLTVIVVSPGFLRLVSEGHQVRNIFIVCRYGLCNCTQSTENQKN